MRQQPSLRRVRRCGVICYKNIFGSLHVLVVRGRRSHIWSLPKGCMQDDEPEWRCAQREAQEETGLWIEIDTRHPRVCINHNVYFVYELSSHSKLRSRDHAEVDKVSWMTLDELRTVDCNKDLRSILQYPSRKFSFHQTLQEPLQLDKLKPVAATTESTTDDEDDE